MFLGIEIGGTKLQLAVGKGDGSAPAAVQRRVVDAGRGAEGILECITRCVPTLLSRQKVERIGIGFGGPVDVSTGRVTKSHQIAGWEDMALVDWCQRSFALPTRIDNDCNVAALAEARFGAGRNHAVVFYVTVGTGVGGGLVIDGRIYGSCRPAVAEIGHLRPGLDHDRPEATVESLASGWGIAANARARIICPVPRPSGLSTALEADSRRSTEPRQVPVDEQEFQQNIDDLRARCQGDVERLTAETVAQAAGEGNQIAREVLADAVQALGWAIAQVITLIAPNVVVVGGGVSQIGTDRFFEPLRREVRRFVFPPLSDSCPIVPAELGELVVVHGALALAAHADVENETPSLRGSTSLRSGPVPR